MRIDLRFEIACPPDAAWTAVHTTAVAAELYGSIMQLEPLTHMPEHFSPGDEVEVELRFAGLVPVGRQVIRVTDETHGTGESLVRTMHDTGHPVSGPLALVNGWHHRMTITQAPGNPGRAIWRDRLEFGGFLAPLVWPVLWATWAWRARRIRKLAPGWRSA
ncbi:hypothetical protein [Leucobacter sp. W1038]|uniref:hypothetical protein n=1 Tax=Leucobacter sp. W1038 TaxID=3438281 RepID=UPI003D97F47D